MTTATGSPLPRQTVRREPAERPGELRARALRSTGGATAARSVEAPTPGVLDVERIRRDFPALAQEVNGHPLAYLDNAASAQKPRSVIERVADAYTHDYSNVHRGVHTLSQRATDAYEAAREKARRFLGAAAPEEVVFVRGATEGINLVAQSFLRPRLEPGDEIVLSAMEHHSNIVPWQLVCAKTGARLRVAPIDGRGELDLAAYEALLGERTRMVAMVHVSNALGTVVPVREVVELARRRGIPTLLDGAQAAPHGPVDVGELGCDFYAISGHKLFGPTGIGALYGRRELLADMEPYQGGGEMIRSVSFEHTDFEDPPHRFEAGTPHIVGAIGLGAAIDYVTAVGAEAIAAHERDLLSYATERLTAIPGIRLIGTARHKVSVLSFVVEGVHAHDVGTILDQEGVAVRVGHHCAQPVMEHFGVPATVRASFAFYNTREEVDRLAAGLGTVTEIFSR
jgi:cysteine desulfurase/selenocysteine lyase